MALRTFAVMAYLLFAFVGIVVTMAVTGLGLWKMAKNAGMPYAWVAFLPVGNGYVTGMLADRSRYFYTGRAPRLGLAFWLPVVQVLPFFGGLGLFGLMVLGGTIFNFLVGLFFVSFFAGTVAAVVLYFFAIYYIFRDYAPDNVLLYTVLGILFNICWVFLLVEMNTVPVSVCGPGPFPGGRPKYGRERPAQYQGDYRQGPDQGPEL